MTAPLSIIDSHAHLDYPQFEGQRDEVLARARELGVTEVITIGTWDSRIHWRTLLSPISAVCPPVAPPSAQVDARACELQSELACRIFIYVHVQALVRLRAQCAAKKQPLLFF